MAVIGVETNLGFEAQRIIHAAQTHPLKRYIALWEGPQDTPGILTTNSSKEIMCRALQELLVNNRLLFSPSFLCTTMSPRAAMQALVVEMKTFMILVAAPNTPFGKPRRTFTGKAGGGQNDDMVRATSHMLPFDSTCQRRALFATGHSFAAGHHDHANFSEKFKIQPLTESRFFC